MKANVFKHTAQERECTVCVEITEKCVTVWAGLCCIIFSDILVNPKCRGAARKVDGCLICWWLPMNQVLCHERVPHCVCGPLFGREGSGWRLCVLLPSHTLWPELVEKELCIRKTILPWVKNNYLTCSCDPLVKKNKHKKHKGNVDNQTGQNWSSSFFGAQVGSLL